MTGTGNAEAAVPRVKNWNTKTKMADEDSKFGNNLFRYEKTVKDDKRTPDSLRQTSNPDQSLEEESLNPEYIPSDSPDPVEAIRNRMVERKKSKGKLSLTDFYISRGKKRLRPDMFYVSRGRRDVRSGIGRYSDDYKGSSGQRSRGEEVGLSIEGVGRLENGGYAVPSRFEKILEMIKSPDEKKKTVLSSRRLTVTKRKAPPHSGFHAIRGRRNIPTDN